MSRIEVAYGICRAVKLIDHPAIWAIRTSVTEGGGSASILARY
jgi:hypothetical protein